MTRILVIDDHPLVRRGVVQALLEGFPGGAVSEASNRREALDALSSGQWNLVVLDISLPGTSGLELLKEIKSLRADTPVLMLSTHPESQFSIRTLRAGAAGYLTKEAPPATLLQAARQVMSGRKFITPTLAEMLACGLGIDSSKEPHERLSDREYDVLLKLGSGYGVSQIAEMMNLSAKTVSTYRTRLLTKLALQNNAELTQYVRQNKLIE